MTEIHIGPIVAELRRLYTSAINSSTPTLIIGELLKQHSAAIYAAFQHGNDAVSFHLGSWCPGLIGQSRETIMSTNLSLRQVEESTAREYGFADWQTVQQLEDRQLDESFESAVELVISGELDALHELLGSKPKLVKQRSGYGHQSTLLHYLGANGVESQRQITPMNCVLIASCLLEYGADVNATANMYGGGSTTLGLVLSSAHPANAGVTDALASVLIDAGGT